MATVRVAPRYHPKTEEILESLGFVIQTDVCMHCGLRVIVTVSLAGEQIPVVPADERFICKPCRLDEQEH